MPTVCATCDHPQVREINHRLREGLPLTDISRWLKELGHPVTRQALARHAKGHLGVEVPHGGRRPVRGRLLETIVESVEDGIESGALTPTIRDGIAAATEINRQADKAKDQDLMVRISMILTGNVALLSPPDPDVLVIEGEFRQLLTPGA